MQATPAVGDADGDGDLDVTTVTREGWSFLWDTAANPGDSDGIDACDDSNEEWWTFHHDEHSTNNYRGDGRPPNRPVTSSSPAGPATASTSRSARRATTGPAARPTSSG